MSGGTILDIVLGLVLLGYAVNGYRQGLMVSALSLFGFLGAGALALGLLPTLLQRWQWLQDREVVRIVVLVFGVFLVASLGQGLMVRLGNRVRSRVRARSLRTVDALLGAVAVAASVAVLLWFIAASVRPAAPAPLARAIGESQLLRTIDRVVPPETGRLFAGFRTMLDRNGFPRVFDGLSPEPITPVQPPDGSAPASAAVTAASGSMVKIVGVAQACNRGQEGSGWVIAPGRVVTNAHVVAGMQTPTVRVQGVGRVYDTTVVVFDPQRDLAVLEVPGLQAPALTLGTPLAANDPAVVAGFPLDGPYRLDFARVRRVIDATGSDIYGQPGIDREIYSLYARVEPGNSGGPLLSTSGKVVGIVFAKSLDDDSTGYALTLTEAKPVLNVAASASRPVTTGACSAG
ncbi:MarP family serine protease [Lapillicoccus sp.]|uniref:MarP family serine protease n=1 Tax=Lapillicoccus sp. TaxID=1909287 RepID=UPI0025DBC773|nr:MarP family serine protease [Lapillicoccus sp.]